MCRFCLPGKTKRALGLSRGWSKKKAAREWTARMAIGIFPSKKRAGQRPASCITCWLPARERQAAPALLQAAMAVCFRSGIEVLLSSGYRRRWPRSVLAFGRELVAVGRVQAASTAAILDLSPRRRKNWQQLRQRWLQRVLSTRRLPKQTRERGPADKGPSASGEEFLQVGDEVLLTYRTSACQRPSYHPTD